MVNVEWSCLYIDNSAGDAMERMGINVSLWAPKTKLFKDFFVSDVIRAWSLILDLFVLRICEQPVHILCLCWFLVQYNSNDYLHDSVHTNSFHVQVLVMTPQILLHNLSHCFIKFELIALLIFDECHYAQFDSNHPYAEIMKVTVISVWSCKFLSCWLIIE